MAEVYVITCSDNDKKYVGLTRYGYKNRFSQHLRDAFEERKDNVLHRAMRKHGITKFGIDCVYKSDDVVLCGLMEQYLIESLKTLTPHGYNSTKGGETAICEEYRDCQLCEGIFTALKDSDVFCSDRCRKEYFEIVSDKSKVVRRICSFCKSTFIVPIPEPDCLFCSIDCEADFYSKIRTKTQRHLNLLGRFEEDNLSFRG